MPYRIMPATQMRQNLRQVLNRVESQGDIYYITQRSIPKAVLARHQDYENLVAQAAEAERLKSSLRWTMGLVANVSAAMELEANPGRYISLLEDAVREGLRRGHVPRGVMATLEDVEPALREWDFKTFRIQQEVKVLEMTPQSLVLGRYSCPPLLDTMRQHASFHIRRIGWRDYRGAARPAVSDFLCLCCSLCCSLEVDWLSDGRFLVAELPQAGGQRWNGVCAYAVRPRAPELAAQGSMG